MIKIDKEKLQHGYYLLQSFSTKIEKFGDEFEDLKELRDWFLTEIGNSIKQQTFKVKPCHAEVFYGIDCLADDERFGFYKSEHDIRPGHAIWIDKNKAERLLELFRRCD